MLNIKIQMVEIGHMIDLNKIKIKANLYKSKIDNLIYYDSSAFKNKNYGETTHQGFDMKTVTSTDNFIYNFNVSNVTSEFDTGSNKGKQLPMVANWKKKLCKI